MSGTIKLNVITKDKVTDESVRKTIEYFEPLVKVRREELKTRPTLDMIIEDTEYLDPLLIFDIDSEDEEEYGNMPEPIYETIERYLPKRYSNYGPLIVVDHNVTKLPSVVVTWFRLSKGLLKGYPLPIQITMPEEFPAKPPIFQIPLGTLVSCKDMYAHEHSGTYDQLEFELLWDLSQEWDPLLKISVIDLLKKLEDFVALTEEDVSKYEYSYQVSYDYRGNDSKKRDTHYRNLGQRIINFWKDPVSYFDPEEESDAAMLKNVKYFCLLKDQYLSQETFHV